MTLNNRRTFIKCISVIATAVFLYGIYFVFERDLRFSNPNYEHDALSKLTRHDTKPLNTLAKAGLGPNRNAVVCEPTLFVTLKRNKRCVRLVNPNMLWKESQEYACVELKISEKTRICIYNPKIDVAVSKNIYQRGIWEPKLVHEFGEALTRYNVTDVLDVGSNIGLYTLKATKLHKRVVAIDANIENLKLLSKSLVLGNLADNVTIIWNAVSDVYSNVTLAHVPGSIARAFIRQDSVSKTSNLVETMLIDDLQHLFTKETVGMKMDVELSELLALRGAQSFLKHVKVKFIQMEIEHHKKLDSGKQIVELLKSHGFTPFSTCLGDDNLTERPVNQWSPDVCFIR